MPFIIFFICFTFSILDRLTAQNPAASSSSSSVNEPIMLPTVVVTEEALPGPASSSTTAYGPELSVLETPRQITQISRQALDTLSPGNLMGYDDLAPLVPSMTTMAPAGDYSVEPFIRGLPATTFRNGMLVGLESYGTSGVLPNFYAYENIDIVQGPVPAVFGAREMAAGYANQITKQPYFDRFRGAAQYSVGMYDQNRWNVDIGGPFAGGKAAYRFDYAGQYSGSYYEGAYMHSQAFYLALSARPTENYSIDSNFEFDTLGFNFPLGINRPDQALIDSGLYQSGDMIGWLGPNGHFHPGIGTSVPGEGYIIQWGPQVPISLRNNLAELAGSGNFLTYGVAQLIQTLKLSDELQLVNNSMYEYVSLLQNPLANSNWTYTPGDWLVENRLEVIAKTNTELGKISISHTLDGGLFFMFGSNTDYTETSRIADNFWNMTKPLSRADLLPPLTLAEALRAQNIYLTDIPVPGIPYITYNTNNFSTGMSQFYQISPFVQDYVQLGKHWSLLFGARLQWYMIGATDPPGTPPALMLQSYYSVLEPQVNASLSYKPYPWMNAYFTYANAQTAAMDVLGGFCPEFTSRYYHLTNIEYEAGVKWNLIHDKLFVTTEGFFYSTFFPVTVLPGGFTPITPADVIGAEIAATYQPNRDWSFNCGFDYLTGEEFWTQSSAQTGPTVIQNYSAAVAAAYNLPVDPYITLPTGVYPFIGFPHEHGTAMISYHSDRGFGINFWLWIQSGMFLSYNYATRIPIDYTLNTSLFYGTDRWKIQVQLYNITDNHYWFPTGTGFQGDRVYNYDKVLIGLPFWVMGTFSVFF
ncbi:TonB-dependent receptor [Candidatus Methylacidiphilum infernorum]|uniref:TonB-dependent receptor n=1 Tax=Candidatus Methylacidiphilum infernorum TaxID=511746 RepID=A0ABX7PSX4_9BACT|nr:TonB-dependent receptor [Candidatus Methylacidiphilum infernorum]QSR86070.1 TonB-dependent receptor [Candidatus Methylacidiphilum infernorum]